MDPNTPNDWMQTVRKYLSEIVLFVGAVIIFAATLTGKIPKPDQYPRTAQAVLVGVLAFVACQFLWEKITRQKQPRKPPETSAVWNQLRLLLRRPKTQAPVAAPEDNSEDEPKAKRPSFLDHLKSLARLPEDHDYVYSRIRRLVMAAVMVLLVVTVSAFIGRSWTAIADEWEKHEPLPDGPSMTCVGSSDPDAPLVLVTSLQQPGNMIFAIDDKLFNMFTDRVLHSPSDSLIRKIRFCRVDLVVTLRAKALEQIEKTKAEIVIWGVLDSTEYEAEIEAPGFDEMIPGLLEVKTPSSLWSVADPQNNLAFLTDVVLAQIYVSNLHLEEGIQLLDSALEEAAGNLDTKEGRLTLAMGYFALGTMYDLLAGGQLPDTSGEAPLPNTSITQDAIGAYTDAIQLDPTFQQPRLNRGFDYQVIGETDLAFDDYTFLITTKEPSRTGNSLAALAYTNRAWLQPSSRLALRDFDGAIKLAPITGHRERGYYYMSRSDYEAAIEDFEEVVRRSPENPLSYHSLGMAQLTAGQYDAAIQTYNNAIPYLTPGDVDRFMLELDGLAAASPDLKPYVAAIRRNLQQGVTPPDH